MLTLPLKICGARYCFGQVSQCVGAVQSEHRRQLA